MNQKQHYLTRFCVFFAVVLLCLAIREPAYGTPIVAGTAGTIALIFLIVGLGSKE
jgi:uncharacterized membrane protein